MKKTAILATFLLLAISASAFAHAIVVGQTYNFEWKITEEKTGAVIESGSESIVPKSGWSLGVRSMEVYTRNNRFNWSGWTRNHNGVRQRLTIKMLDSCPEGSHD